MKTDNEIIAEFMGAELLLGGAYKKVPIPPNKIIIEDTCLKYPEELEYHKSWDWLMPVVNKIAEYRLVHAREVITAIDWKITIGIEYIYPKLVEFIKFYNAQKQ